MRNVFLVEDHDEALKIWRREEVKGLDLVHVDAHRDIDIQPAEPIARVFGEAKSVKELKKRLERSLAFLRYEKNFDKQTNMGNYIYPAIKEGIVNDFYWIVPGKDKEFKKSVKWIKKMIKNLSRRSPGTKRNRLQVKDGLIRTRLFDRNFVICTLERLPCLRRRALLDIDTDFLVINSLLGADNVDRIGKRRPWISPQDLVHALKEKVSKPRLISISYSVNGGWTPMQYKYLGDEIAYHFAPEKFGRRFRNNAGAAEQFKRFISTGEGKFYRKAVKLDSAYRAADNNYGPLYLSLRRFSLAQAEFLKVLNVDRGNPACLAGLGNIALERRDFNTAKRHFSSALNSPAGRPFNEIKDQTIFGLARAEFGLRNYERAKNTLFSYKARRPLHPGSYYLLGRIFEKEKDFKRAARFYQDAVRLGLADAHLKNRLQKIKKKGGINVNARK